MQIADSFEPRGGPGGEWLSGRGADADIVISSRVRLARNVRGHRFLIQAAIGYPLTVHGTGGQTRAFIHIQDSVRCIELALKSPPAKGDRGDAKGSDYDVDLDVPILTGFNSEAITNGTLKFARRGGEIRSANFRGRIGKADVSARQGRPGDQPGLRLR